MQLRQGFHRIAADAKLPIRNRRALLVRNIGVVLRLVFDLTMRYIFGLHLGSGTRQLRDYVRCEHCRRTELQDAFAQAKSPLPTGAVYPDALGAVVSKIVSAATKPANANDENGQRKP
jgi:hypothetical protein